MEATARTPHISDCLMQDQACSLPPPPPREQPEWVAWVGVILVLAAVVLNVGRVNGWW